MTSLTRRNADDNGPPRAAAENRDFRDYATAPGIPAISAHFGEQYEATDEPEALVYRQTGGQFRFLAFAFPPWRMWDPHIGVVPIGDRRLSIGFHISERAGPILIAALWRLASGIGVTVQHQAAVVEYQANLPPSIIDDVPFEDIVHTLIDLCRQFARVAAETICPSAMRDAATSVETKAKPTT
jgi:hypothetical protein